jgi:hypothetical protein
MYQEFVDYFLYHKYPTNSNINYQRNIARQIINYFILNSNLYHKN